MITSSAKHVACFIMSYLSCMDDFEKICLNIDSFKFVWKAQSSSGDEAGRLSDEDICCMHSLHFLQKCTKTTVLHPKHAYSIDSNCSVVLAGLTKGEKIVASDPFPQTIKKFEVLNAISLSCMKRQYHKGHSFWKVNKNNMDPWKLLSSEMCCLVLMWKFTDISEDNAASVIYPDDGGNRVLWFHQAIRCHASEYITTVTNSYSIWMGKILLIKKFFV